MSAIYTSEDGFNFDPNFIDDYDEYEYFRVIDRSSLNPEIYNFVLASEQTNSSFQDTNSSHHVSIFVSDVANQFSLSDDEAFYCLEQLASSGQLSPVYRNTTTGKVLIGYESAAYLNAISSIVTRRDQEFIDTSPKVAIQSDAHLLSVPKIWGLFDLFLPRKARIDLYQPAHFELVSDYYGYLLSAQTLWNRRWWTWIFTVRTAVMWSHSLQAWTTALIQDYLNSLAVSVVGEEAVEALKRILREFFQRGPF